MPHVTDVKQKKMLVKKVDSHSSGVGSKLRAILASGFLSYAWTSAQTVLLNSGNGCGVARSMRATRAVVAEWREYCDRLSIEGR